MKRFIGLGAITLFLLGCGSASAQIVLGFLSSDMSTQYCDFEVFDTQGALTAGVDVLEGCGAPDGVMIGLKATFPPSNLPVTGTVYVMADSLLDASCECFTGAQLISITKTQAYNIHAPHFGWETLVNTYDGFYAYLDNWGYLTNELPFAPATKGAKSAPLRTSFSNPSRARNMMK